jgi:hypothetical protein
MWDPCCKVSRSATRVSLQHFRPTFAVMPNGTYVQYKQQNGNNLVFLIREERYVNVIFFLHNRSAKLQEKKNVEICFFPEILS